MTPDSKSRLNPAVLLFASVAIFALGLAVFANALTNPFFLDDRDTILENQSIRDLSPWWQPLFPPDESPVAGRPVANLTFAVNYLWSGDNPYAYHATNLALHCLVACVLFALLHRTLTSRYLDGELDTTTTAFVIAVLWLVHPLNAETINYVTQRTEILVALAYLLVMYCADRAWANPWPWELFSIGLCAIGMATKEVMVSAPMMVILYDYAFRERDLKFLWQQRRLLYLGLIACWAVLVALLATGPRTDSVGFHLQISSFDYLLSQCWTIGHYLKSSFWPFQLYHDYGSEIHRTLGEVLPGGIMIMLLLGATAWGWRYYPPVGFLGVWFFFILAPSSSFVPIVTEIGADRRMYLPLMAVLAAVVIGSYQAAMFFFLKRSTVRYAALLVVISAIFGFSIRSWLRNAEYKDPVAAWQAASRAIPDNARAHNNLAEALLRAGRYGEAVAAAQQAVDLVPGAIGPLENLALALRKAGDLDAALSVNSRIIQLGPQRSEHWLERGNIFASRKHIPEWRQQAIDSFQKAISLDENSSEAFNGLGSVYSATDPSLGLSLLQRAVTLKPENVQARNNLANALARAGRFDEAIAQYQAAIIIQPKFMEAQANLQVVLELKRAAGRDQ